MWRWTVALVLSTALAVGGTGPKLYKMAQIKGWAPGATVAREVITQKGVDQRQGRRNNVDSYWITCAAGGDRGSWAERETVSAEVWHTMHVGDAVELVRVPGDCGSYLRNGVFVSQGNFAFDIVLLTVALGVAVASAGRLLWWLARFRTTAAVGPNGVPVLKHW